MGRSVRLIAVLVGVVVPLVACSLVVDTSGLGDGAAAGASDSSTDTATSTSPPTDAPAGDVATTTDASTDAPVDAAEGGATCVDVAGGFCDDFDSPLPGSKWTSTDKTRGEVTFDDVGLSLPRAMHAKVLAGSNISQALLSKEVPAPGANIHCELDLRLDNIPATGEIDVLAIITAIGGNDKHNVYLANFNGTWTLAEYANGVDGGPPLDRSISLGAALPDATWFHVAMDVHPTEATLTANGHFIKLAAITRPTGTSHKVQVGITYADFPIQSGGVYVDNVSCTFAP
jgi:hypothetical protein